MKTPTIITAFLLITCLTVVGQTYFPFPESNAHWNVYLESSWQDNPTDTTLLRYTLHGDTTINDVLYMKLCLEKGDTINPVLEPIGGLREDEKRVLFIGRDFLGAPHDEERLLYDFNKQVGDTVFHYDNRFSVILGIDSILIGDDYRKRYEVDNNWYYHNPDFVVEGIGSIKNGLLGHITMIPIGGYYSYWEHVCFRENGDLKYLNPTFSDCFPNFTLNSINHKVGSSSIGIYPNPFLDELRIDNIPVNTRIRILLINTVGQIVLDKELSATNNLVPFHGNTGIYIALIMNDEGLIVKKEKVIKK